MGRKWKYCIDVGQEENKKHLDDEKSSNLTQSANRVMKHFAGISISDSIPPLHDFSHPISTIFIRHGRGYYFFVCVNQ
jgi:hypothetical protein